MNPDDTELRNFLGAYFHQDWLSEATSWSEAVDQYLSESSPQSRVRAANAIRRLLQTDIADTDLGNVLERQFLCFYLPPGDGLSYRRWLEELLVALERVGGESA